MEFSRGENSRHYNELIARHKASKDKGGLGLEKVETSKSDQIPNTKKTQDKNNNGEVWNQRNNARRTPIRQPNDRRYPSFNGICYFFNKFGHRAMECRSKTNQNFASFTRQYFTYKKFGHRVNECRSQIMNVYNTSRMIQSFNGYYYTCYGFGYKANQCISRMNETNNAQRMSYATIVIDLDILLDFVEAKIQG